MISCPECRIGLPDDTRRCPYCQRLLLLTPFTRRIGFAALILIPLLVVFGLALVSHSVESKLLWRRTSSTDAYQAALTYLKAAPDLRGAVRFSNQQESLIERWGPTRFRVSGYVDLQPHSGTRTHNSYSCVLRFDGSDRWEVEDLHIETLR